MTDVKQITIWERWDEQREKFSHNHIQDGWSEDDEPESNSQSQRKAWTNAIWVKRFGYLINGVVSYD